MGSAMISAWRATTSVLAPRSAVRASAALAACRASELAARSAEIAVATMIRASASSRYACGGGEQRATRRHLAGQQVLEQVALLAVVVDERVLLKLRVDVGGVRAGEVDVAHHRTDERQRRLVAYRRGAGALEQRIPEDLLADAESVDVILERKSGAGATHGRLADEGEILQLGATVLEQEPQLGAVVEQDLLTHVGEQAIAALCIGHDLALDRRRPAIGKRLDVVQQRREDSPALESNLLRIGQRLR